MASRVTPDIIRLGVMNSSDMICYPYKVTLGQQTWCLEHGATNLIMFDTEGLCRFKHYHQLQELTLRSLGYSFSMVTFTMENFKHQLAELLGTSINLIDEYFTQAYLTALELEEESYGATKERQLNIGIVGEIYTILEHDINYDIVNKLHRMGANVSLSMTLSDFIREHLGDDSGKEQEKEEAKKLLPQEIGGHGFHSIYNTIFYANNGYDGIIHLMPLSCMPESTVEVVVDKIAQERGIPLYRFPIDESNFEAGINTRLETFVSMLKRKKR